MIFRYEKSPENRPFDPFSRLSNSFLNIHFITLQQRQKHMQEFHFFMRTVVHPLFLKRAYSLLKPAVSGSIMWSTNLLPACPFAKRFRGFILLVFRSYVSNSSSQHFIGPGTEHALKKHRLRDAFSESVQTLVVKKLFQFFLFFFLFIIRCQQEEEGFQLILSYR